jgi:L-threonylcarbamoyladenylate synthase
VQPSVRVAQVTLRISCADGLERERAVAAAHAAARRGDLILLPTEHVYAVAADAFSPRGVAALREAKGTGGDVPLPVMVGRRATVTGIAARVSDQANRLMDAFWPGPLTILLNPQPTLAWDLPEGAPVAVRMPLHPLTLAVLASTGPLAATTANLPGLESPSDVDDALEQLGGAVTVALDSGVLGGADSLPSSVVDCTRPMPVMVRIGALSAEAIARICPDVQAGDRPIGA